MLDFNAYSQNTGYIYLEISQSFLTYFNGIPLKVLRALWKLLPQDTSIYKTVNCSEKDMQRVYLSSKLFPDKDIDAAPLIKFVFTRHPDETVTAEIDSGNNGLYKAGSKLYQRRGD